MKQKYNKMVRWIRRQKRKIAIILILLFPVVVGFLYALPIPQVVCVASGDLLSYYGVVFGILGSFVTYQSEARKRKRERLQNIRPQFVVKVNKSTSSTYEIDIRKIGDSLISYLYLYDEFVDDSVKAKYTLKVAYNKTVEEMRTLKLEYNITMDLSIIDKDGYPRYVQLICDDVDGNAWDLCYDKVVEGDKVFYYPSMPEIH